MLIVLLISYNSNYHFYKLGIYPREINGLIGIITASFIHENFNHFINNAVPLLLLGTGLFYFYKELAIKVWIIIYFFSGFWLWIAGRPSYHIGSSTLLYGIWSFLFISGIIRKNSNLMALSLLVLVFYGGMIWGIFPIKYKISWEGHLFGMLAGISMAVYYRNKGPEDTKYSWDYEDELENKVEDNNKAKIRIIYKKKN